MSTRPLCGTPMWEKRGEEPRIALTTRGICSLSGVGIGFECLLMQLALRDLDGDDPAKPPVRSAMTEIADVPPRACEWRGVVGSFPS